MSAFLCDNCHLTALASYAYEIKPALTLGTTRTFFDMFVSENVRSLERLYTNRAPYPDNRFWEEQLPNARPCLLCERAHFEPYEIVKAADCYAYQSDNHDGWNDSEACRVIDRIREHALACEGWAASLDSLRASVAYDHAHWGIDPKHATRGALTEYIQGTLEDIDAAAGDLLDATERWLSGRRRHAHALEQQLLITGAEHTPNTEEPDQIRRYLLALHELIGCNHDQLEMLQDCARSAGITL
jgi:hypothetical protein